MPSHSNPWAKDVGGLFFVILTSFSFGMSDDKSTLL